MAPTNTTTTIGYRAAAYIEPKLLQRMMPLMVTEPYGQPVRIPKNKTKTINFRRHESLPVPSAPLAEGVRPSPQTLRVTTVTGTLQREGSWVPVTDDIADHLDDPIIQDLPDLLGEQAALTMETRRIDVLKGGTNVYYASGVAGRTTVAAAPTRADLVKIYRGLRRVYAPRFRRIIKPSLLYNTIPVRECYVMVIHTDLEDDFRSITGFVPCEKYPGKDALLPGEIGAVEGFRIVSTEMLTPWLAGGADGTTLLSNGDVVTSDAAADVYPCLALSKDAFGTMPLRGRKKGKGKMVKPVNVHVEPPGKPTKGDELGQNGFASWKAEQLSVILNNTLMARLEVGCTATPS
jgi:N4-gp56 family major capsid protein